MMSRWNTFSAILALGTLGLLGLGGGLFWLGQHCGRPMVLSAATDDPPQTNALELLTLGTFEAVRAAAYALERNDRNGAVDALDAAMRAIQVASDVSGEADFERACQTVHSARQALRDGRRQDALHWLDTAAGALNQGTPPDLRKPDQRPSPSPDLLAAYRGATVLNVQGIRIGVVEAVQDEQFLVVLRGCRNLFRFLRVPADRRLELPARQCLLGNRKADANLLIVLPTRATLPDDISRTLLRLRKVPNGRNPEPG